MLRTWRQRVTFIDVVVWAIGVAIAVMVVVGTIKTLLSGKYTPTVWLDLFIRGVALGGVYALIAMGYTLVYGILKMINFAHSEVFMSGPFTAVFLAISLAKSGYMDRHPFLGMLWVTLLAMAVSRIAICFCTSDSETGACETMSTPSCLAFFLPPSMTMFQNSDSLALTMK